ncbi:MAG: signal recognition particle-docking protein FtsY [Oscillospiraceae bacterium]|nr:signal recognition particle-docking protein FtsY [Oscillospiraceae bacterium]
MGFFEKLKNGLAKTKKLFLQGTDSLFRAFSGKLDDDFYDELEELLILADVGAVSSAEIIDKLKQKIKEDRIMDGEGAKSALKDVLCEMISFDGGTSSGLDLSTKPSVILVIGVNGVGKTTSIAKIAKCLSDEGKKVTLAAADTFRAAAIDQLEIWADRVGADMIKQNEGADPAAVVFDAISSIKKTGRDVLIVDTAGRLHNKKNLMDELAKINRVITRELPDCAREVLLVLDATTGQNAVNQAKEFKNAAGITGLVLTKLDGTAKGGIVFSLKNELGIPVKFVGVGEKADDLKPFNARDFVNALFENDNG